MSVAAAKRRLPPMAKAVAPRWFWRRKYRILARLGQAHGEMRTVRSLCDPARVSVDIGADVGEFAIAMAETSRSVIAFEPRPAQAKRRPLSESYPGIHQDPANIGNRADGCAWRGVYINNFVFLPS